MNAGGPAAFDPYYIWLGIPPSEQPPSHYRLLGLRNFETNVRAIENAADRLMLQIRTFQAGPNGVAAQRILNEIATARITLCDEAKKGAYDRQLQARLQPQAAPRPLPVAAPLPQPVQPAHAAAPYVPPHLAAHNTPPHATPIHPIAAPVPVAPLPVGSSESAPMMAIDTHEPAHGSPAVRSSVRRRPADASGGLVMTVIKAAVGGAGGISLGLVIVWIGWRADPFGLFGEKPKPNTTVAQQIANAPTPVAPTTSTAEQTASDSSNTNTQTTTASKTPSESTASNTSQSAAANPMESPATRSSAPGSGANSANPNGANDASSAQPASNASSPSPGPTVTPSEPRNPPSGSKSPDSDPQPLRNPVPFGPRPNEPVTGANSPNPNQSNSPPAAEPKAATPTPEIQKSKLAELKEIYKSEFDTSSKPANRESFIEFLITTAGRVKSDPAAQFVLYREAYDRAVALKDFEQAAKIVDLMEETFEVDPFRLRIHLLTQASPTARQPAERLVVARCALELAEAAVMHKRVSDAKKLATIAEVHVKLIPDPQFRSQALADLNEIDKLAAQAAPVDRAQKTLAENPDNPDANFVLGKYRCFAEGNWGEGLALLAKCSDEQLAETAQADLEAINQGAPPSELGDRWFELAKGSEEFKPAFRRAEHWYQQALEGTDGLERIKIEQRLEQIAAMDLPRAKAATASTSALRKFSQMIGNSDSFDPVNVFTHLNPAILRSSNAPWSGSGDTLYSNYRAARAWLQSTYVPPREYQATFRVRRSDTPGPGDPGFIIGLSTQRQQFVIAVDAVVAGGYATAISMPGLRSGKPNPTLVTYTERKLGDVYRFDPTTRSYSYGSTIVCEVSTKKIRVLIDGQEVTSYEGEFGQLGVPREWTVPDPKALFIGSNTARFEVSRWSVEPIGEKR